MAGVAITARHTAAGVAGRAIGGVEQAGLYAAAGREGDGGAAQPIERQVAEDAVDRFSDPLFVGVVVGRGGRGRAAGGHLFQVAEVDGGGRAAAAGHLLLDTVPFAIVEVAGGGRRAAGGVLPGGELALVIVTELRPRLDACAGAGRGRRAAGHAACRWALSP